MKVTAIICVLVVTYFSGATSTEASEKVPSLLTFTADSTTILDGPDHAANLKKTEEKPSQRDTGGKEEVNQLNEVVKSIRLQITDALKEVVNQVINQLKQVLNDVRKRVLVKLSKVTLSDLFILLFGGISELVATPTNQNHYPDFHPQVYHNQKPIYSYKDNSNIDLFSYEPEYNDEEEAYYKSADLVDVVKFKKVDIKTSDDVAEIRNIDTHEQTKEASVSLPLSPYKHEQDASKKTSKSTDDVELPTDKQSVLESEGLTENREIDLQTINEELKKESISPLPVSWLSSRKEENHIPLAA